MLLFVFYKHVSFSMTGDSVLSFCFSGHESFAIHFLRMYVWKREEKNVGYKFGFLCSCWSKQENEYGT